jgi:hypothetical protein
VTKRETGFLLIGLAFGLLLSIAAVLEVLLSLYRSALITDYGWDKVFVFVPILLLAIGLVLVLRRSQWRADS